MPAFFRRFRNPWRIPQNYQNGTTMDLAQDKPREKTVKSFYSKIVITIYYYTCVFFFICKHFTVAFLTFLFSVSSPQAIFKDPFRGGNNVLVLPIATESALLCCST